MSQQEGRQNLAGRCVGSLAMQKRLRSFRSFPASVLCPDSDFLEGIGSFQSDALASGGRCVHGRVFAGVLACHS
jgi:hypothetical protein